MKCNWEISEYKKRLLFNSLIGQEFKYTSVAYSSDSKIKWKKNTGWRDPCLMGFVGFPWGFESEFLFLNAYSCGYRITQIFSYSNIMRLQRSTELLCEHKYSQIYESTEPTTWLVAERFKHLNIFHFLFLFSHNNFQIENISKKYFSVFWNNTFGGFVIKVMCVL